MSKSAKNFRELGLKIMLFGNGKKDIKNSS